MLFSTDYTRYFTEHFTYIILFSPHSMLWFRNCYYSVFKNEEMRFRKFVWGHKCKSRKRTQPCCPQNAFPRQPIHLFNSFNTSLLSTYYVAASGPVLGVQRGMEEAIPWLLWRLPCSACILYRANVSPYGLKNGSWGKINKTLLFLCT